MKKIFKLGGLEGRRSKSDLVLNQLRDQAEGGRESKSRLSLSSSDEEDRAVTGTLGLPQPIIFVSSAPDIDGLILPLPLFPKSASAVAEKDYLLSSDSDDDTDNGIHKNGNEADAESRSSQEDRQAKTEPYTPEAEKTVPLQKQPSDSGSAGVDGRPEQLVKKRNDSKGQPRSPSKEIVPKMNLARNTKFHKLFKELPANEICIKGYSCAFLGDILIQGYLYISPNWFCFHSRILGIEKQIKIPVCEVLNITREKTAIFIPNAIGVVTSEDKYVFGSLMSRDNTYRIMFTVWKTLRQQDETKPDLADINLSIEEADNGENNNNISKETGSIESDESESSICIRCGVPVAEHSGDQCDGGSDDIPDSSYAEPPTPTTSSRRDVSTAPSTPSTYKSVTSGNCTTPSQASSLSSPETKQASVMQRFLQSARRTPRTHLMLFLCLVMVFFLATSAVIMLNKILLLQSRLDTSPASSSTALPLDSQGMYSNMYYLNQEYHMTSIKRFHSVLEANIQVLDQIFNSLKGLQSSLNLSSKDCSSGSGESIAENAASALHDKT